MKSKNILFAFVLMFLCNLSWAQVTLKYHYPLNNGSGQESISRHDGVVTGSVSNHADRFGNTSGAMSFSNNAYVSTPPLLANIPYMTSGVTFSFWVYVGTSLQPHTGRYPWSDTDPIVRSFFAKKNNVPLMGFYRRGDRAVVDRYLTATDNQTKTWGVWFWDPVNFTEKVGWYHIYLCLEPSRTFIYVFSPDGQIARSGYYMGLQDMQISTIDWGIGNNSGPSFVMDDFKVYQGTATYAEVRQLHAQEALPDGMYKVAICADATKLVHTYTRATSSGTPLEILQQGAGDDMHVYKWVFSPVSGEAGVYKIRMAYESKYIHICSDRSIDLQEYDSQLASEYLWYVEPAGGGYFYIRRNSDRNMYLHTKSHSYANSARLEVLAYNSSYAPVYKWKLELIKTNHELNESIVVSDAQYEMDLSDNTALGLMVQLPYTTAGTAVNIDRSAYTSLLNSWRFHKTYDDAYRMYYTPNPSFNLHPTSRVIQDGTVLQALTYSTNPDLSSYYDFVLTKPNKYGRRIQLRPARNQVFSVSAESKAAEASLMLRRDDSGKPNQWAAYQSQTANAQKQVYFLRRGIYRIVSMDNTNKSITTSNYGWSASTNLVLKSTSLDRYTSHYWVIDYEYDAAGYPVMDGTYTIKLFGTDQLFFHTKANSFANSTKLELFALDRDNNKVYSGKWFITPTRDGDGAFYIQSAGDPTKYVHLTEHSSAENKQIELLNYNPSYANTYRWKFEQVLIYAPFDGGTYTIASQKAPSMYLHARDNSTAEGVPLEIVTKNPSAAPVMFQWRFVLMPDNTYMIRNVASGYYIHPYGSSTASGTTLQQRMYFPQDAPYYKWIVVPGDTDGAYNIHSVADPTKLIHLVGNTSYENNGVDIKEYDSSHKTAFEWQISE